MNSWNDNIHTASGVAQDKKVRVQALSRGGRLKISYILPHNLNVTRNQLTHSLRVWEGKRGQYTISVCTRVGLKIRDLCMGIWNVTPLNEKE